MPAVISWQREKPIQNGRPVPEGSDLPVMRPRTGKRGTDAAIIAMLAEALEELGSVPCAFWACEGPRRMQHMITCRKCYAMRTLGTAKATLQAR